MTRVQGGNPLTEVVNFKFPDATYEEWLDKANRALKGKDISEYNRKTYENITIKPLYTKEDLPTEYERINPDINSGNKWNMAQKVLGQTAEEVNTNLQKAIIGGQDTIAFKIPSSINKTNLKEIFKQIDVENIPFFLDGKEEIIPFYVMLAEGLKDQYQIDHFTGFIGTDPVSIFCEKGLSRENMKTFYDIWKESLQYANEQFPSLKTVYIDGTIYEKSGGNAVQQLAYSLATAVEHIEQLKEIGWSPEDSMEKMVFGFSIGSQFFMEIAKLRAARYLWKKVAETYDVDRVKMNVFAETTIVNKSKLDPYTNMLRLGGESFAAVIGQVQTLRVNPYDEVFGNVSSLGSRLGRNVHHLLREEAKLSLVSDPAGGSYFIEALSKQLIEKAWNLFLSIEDDGGILANLKDGKVQEQLATMRANKQTDFQLRKTKLIGTNQYVDITEKLHEPFESNNHEQISGYLQDKTFQQIIKRAEEDTNLNLFFTQSVEEGNRIAPIVTYRLSEPYEKLRYEVSRFEREIGKKPAVILINGNGSTDKKALSDSVAEFLRGAGIATEIRQGEDFDKIIKETGKKLYCFYGTDQELTDLFPKIEGISQKYPDKEFMIAGIQSMELQKQFEQIGIHFFINTKDNQVKFLDKIVSFLIRGEKS